MYREPVTAREREIPQEVMPEYKRPKQEVLSDYPITIRFLSIGCIVEVGCKSIPFTSIVDAMREVNEYVENPHEAQEKWRRILS
jgi:hypothetical protein